MKKKIWIRILCLLLCVSMLSPTTAAATSSLDEDEVKFNLQDGETTNAMAYVDQFYNDDGSFSEVGLALKYWLEMTEKGDDVRANSGYLMLESQFDFQNEHKAAEYSAKAANLIIDSYFVFYPIVLAKEVGTELVSDVGYQNKFPGAGKSAYIYYEQLYSIYFDYAGRLQEKIAEVEDAWKTISDMMGTVTQIIRNDTGNAAVENIRLVSAKIEEPDLMDSSVVVFKCQDVEFNGTVEVWSPVGIHKGADFDENGNWVSDAVEVYEFETPEGMITKTSSQMLEICKDGGVVGVDTSKLKGINREDFEARLMEDAKGAKSTTPSGQEEDMDIDMDVVLNLAEGVEAVMNRKLPDGTSRYSGIFREAITRFKKVASKVKVETPVEDQIIAKEIGVIKDIMGIANDVNKYYGEKGRVSAQQEIYLNAIDTATDEYLYMLAEWRSRVRSSGVDNAQDIVAALDAIIRDAGDLRHKTVEEIAKHDADYFTRGKVAELVLDTSFSVLNIKMDADDIKNLKNSLKSGNDSTLTAKTNSEKILGFMSQVSGTLIKKSALTQIVRLKSNLANVVNFRESVEAVRNLKKSLYYTLEDDSKTTSLLTLYSKERNHKNARAIIDALDTMKSAKIVGEELISEYYLMGLYEETGVSPGGAGHLLLYNSILENESRGKLEAYEKVTPIIIVYEDTAVRKSVDPTTMTGDTLMTYYYKVDTEIQGYYLKNSNDSASFGGVKLTALPQQFLNITSSKPYDVGLRYDAAGPYQYYRAGDTTFSEEWQQGHPVTVNNINNTYYKEGVLVSCNGMEAIMTNAEYEDYLSALQIVNELIETDKNNMRELSEEEDQYMARMEMSFYTRKWIESFEMYDDSVDYKTHAVKHGIVPN